MLPQISQPGRGLTGGARVTLLLLATLSALAVSGLTPILSTISAHFAAISGASSLVRLLVTSVGGAMIVGAPLAGILAERIGQHRLMMLSLVAYAAAGCAGYVIDTLWALIVTRILLGLAASAIGVLAAAAIVNRLGPGERERWLGFYGTAGTLGALVLIPVAGLIGGIDWRAVFLLHLIALPMLVMAGVFMPHALSVAPVGASVRAASGTRLPVGLVLLGIACGISASTTVLFLPFHLATLGEVAPGRTATAMLPAAMTAAASAFSYGWIRRRLAIMDTFALGFLLAATGTLLVAAAGSYPAVLLGMATGGIGIGLLTPNLFATAAVLATPERRARSLGFARAGLFGGPLIAQLPLELLSGTHGARGALLALALFGGVLALAMLASRHRLRAHPDPA